MKHIVMLSGGKDSTAMLSMMIEKGMQIDEVICVDTTKEFPAMYDHIEEIKKIIPVTILKIDFDFWFAEHVKTRGKNKGSKGYGWPYFCVRWCTALKRDTILRYLKKYGQVIEYQGIAADEVARTERNSTSINVIKYPLVEWGVTEADALQYCYDNGYTWNGLYKKFHRVSCFCCPLSRIGELRTVYKEFPELWGAIRELDVKSTRRFRSDYSLTELESKFKEEEDANKTQPPKS